MTNAKFNENYPLQVAQMIESVISLITNKKFVNV